MDADKHGFQPLNWRQTGLWTLVGIACFHVAYTPAKSGWLALGIIGYLICLLQLARLRNTRICFYTGLAVGMACYAPQLECFWRIFGVGAVALWLVLAFWIGLFLALSHQALVRFGPRRGVLLVPFLWIGLEYFRCELYYLKFSWLNVGYVLPTAIVPSLNLTGMYGVGFLVVLILSLLSIRPAKPTTNFSFAQTIGIALLFWVSIGSVILSIVVLHVPQPTFVLAGVQMEFPLIDDVRRALDKIVLAQTNIQLRFSRPATNVDVIVLPEYTLDGEPTDELKAWCKANQKFLIVGGKDSSLGTNFYNTAFVISTNGEIVFKQVKSVPIQFFKDGLPAPEQKVWDSPWGKIGICICYDLSYTRVTDELVRQGAQMLIVPTMDVAEWGRHQHELHARVAPVRAAEYGIPIFRVASSGISQGVNRTGRIQSSAPFPGEGAILFFGARLSPGLKGSLPLDRWLAPFCVLVTGAFTVWLMIDRLRLGRLAKRKRVAT